MEDDWRPRCTPFWYLQNDELWEVPEADRLEYRAGKPEPKVTALRASAHGGFPEPVDAALRADSILLRQAAQLLLDRHFEPSTRRSRAAAGLT